jgi:hypothetical protein
VTQKTNETQKSFSESRRMVTGPSLVSSRDIIVWKMPVCTCTPRWRSAVFFVELVGFVGRGGPDETWSSLATGIAIEGELRNNERGPVDVDERQVHFSGFVGEDAHRGSFLGEISCRPGCVAFGHTKQHDQANTNLTGHTLVHQHASLANTLDNSSHAKNASATAILAFEQRLSERVLMTGASCFVLSGLECCFDSGPQYCDSKSGAISSPRVVGRGTLVTRAAGTLWAWKGNLVRVARVRP